MRLPQVLAFILLILLCACNTFTSDTDRSRPKPKLKHQLEDSILLKIRKRQDSLLELREKRIRKKDLDTLKPIQA